MLFVNPADAQVSFDTVEVRKRVGTRYGMPLIWSAPFAGRSIIEIANPIRVYAHDQVALVSESFHVQGLWFEKARHDPATFVDHGNLVTSVMLSYESVLTHDMESRQIMNETWAALGPLTCKESDVKSFPTAAEMAEQRLDARMQELLKQMRNAKQNKVVFALKHSERAAIVAALKEKGYTVTDMQGMLVEISW